MYAVAGQEGNNDENKSDVGAGRLIPVQSNVGYLAVERVLLPKDAGYDLGNQLGHSIIKPVASLFTFKIDDIQLTVFGITFPKVKASLKLESLKKSIPQLTQLSGGE